MALVIAGSPQKFHSGVGAKYIYWDWSPSCWFVRHRSGYQGPFDLTDPLAN